MKIIRNENIAFVEFCETGAVETVLKKKPIMLGPTELTVKPYKALLAGNETIARVDVMGLHVPKDFTENLLQKYLQPKRPVPTSGPELAVMIKVGTRVVRGKDWEWADQGSGSEGTVIKTSTGGSPGWITVEWDNGDKYNYRMGADDC